MRASGGAKVRGGMRVAKTETTSEERAAEPQPCRSAGISAWQFRLAVLRHQGLVYRVARSMLRDAHEAEDVTQEAFLRLWQQGGGIRRRREWLLTVTRNACLDRLRGARRRPAADTDAETLERQAEDRGPEWHLEQGELAQRLQALIAALPEPQRSLVVLFDVHGVDGATCARILGLSPNQTKVYLHRARRRLRLALEESA